ncbi:MAG: hypothetical protein ACOX02_03825 [Acholeplasmatales bacterium]
MRELSSNNSPIVRKEVSYQEALKLFKNDPYKLELIKELKRTSYYYPFSRKLY